MVRRCLILLNIFLILILSHFLISCKLNTDVQSSVGAVEDPPADPGEGDEGSTENSPEFTYGAMFASFSKWNDYIQWPDPNVNLTQLTNPLSCVGTETGHARACVQVGNKILLKLTHTNSCSNVTASDSLSAFYWGCFQIGEDVYVFNTDFMPNKGLVDLIASSAWLPFKVMMTVGTENYETPSQAWWIDPIVSPADNGGGGDSVVTLNSANTIYVIDADRETQGYNIDADGISLIVEGGATLSYAGSATDNCSNNTGEIVSGDRRCLLSAGGQKFLWIEGQFDGEQLAASRAEYGIHLRNNKYSRLHNVSIQNIQTQTLRLKFVDHSIFTNLKVTRSLSNAGIEVQDANYNTFYNIVSVNNNQGLYMTRANYNTFTRFITSGTGYQIEHDGSHYNIISHLSSLYSSYYGLDFWWGDYNTVHQVLSHNHSPNGLKLGDTNAEYNTISQAYFSRSATGISSVDATGTKFSGLVLLGNNTTNCGTPTGTQPGHNNSCNATDLSDATMAADDLKYDSALDLVGFVTSDTSNTSQASGQASYPTNPQIFDWFNFENPFRFWAKTAADLTATSVRGVWSSSTGQILDVRLKKGATTIAGRSGNGVNLNEAFVPGATCPSAVNGNSVATSLNLSLSPYLRNAMEIHGDFVGNDNGLCESNERCIYSPNFGAYQGEGDPFSQGSCNFQDGTVSGVIMYGHLDYAI